MQRGYNVVIFEKNYMPDIYKEWDEAAEIQEQKKQFQTWFSPFAAKEREKELYREEVLEHLKKNYQKFSVFWEAISLFDEHAQNEHGRIKVYVNESNMKATIEISCFFLFEDNPKINAFLSEHNCPSGVSLEDQRCLVDHVTFDLS